MATLDDLRALGYTVEPTHTEDESVEGGAIYSVAHDQLGIQLTCRKGDTEIIDSLGDPVAHEERPHAVENPREPMPPSPTPEQELAEAIVAAKEHA